ncbi:MAG: GtrA family protein [Candidatus Doudnabacteria bacterium]|nr:GtrA family protein [Candidatus Doudnabacteria bacterium]
MNKLVHAEKKGNKKAVVFLAVGIFNTTVDFLFYTFLTQLLFTEPSQIGLAGIASGTFALVCAFLTHGLITWRGSSLSHKTMFKFFVFTGFGMWIIRPTLLSIFIHFDGIYQLAFNASQSIGLPFSYAFVSNTGAFGFMVLFVLIYNYFTYDRFVFKKSRIT